MSLKPTVTLHGALPVLQLEYYYSDLFLTPLRLDLDKLLTDFARCLLNKPDQGGLAASSSTTDQTGASPEQNSFGIFKTCWVSNHWSFMHLRCLDAIGRVAFLHVLHRMFLAFRVLPVSDLRPLNPTVLPQTFVAISTTDQDTRPRGPGRVTLTQRLRTAKRAVDELHALLDGDDSHTASQDIAPLPSSTDYTHLRALMIATASSETVAEAVRETSQNLHNAEVMLTQEGVTVEVDPELHGGQLLGLVRDTAE
ncbi:hypothetical protein FRC07_014878 [Ceratobasidium sp. 392]|nr:hypothetical protein FRC07_014878 [Ceratobasidium sp. 392]